MNLENRQFVFGRKIYFLLFNIKFLSIFNVLIISMLSNYLIMKSNRCIMVAFFIVTLLNSSCSDTFVDDIDLKFCGKCANTGRWTVDSLDFNPCFSSKTECLDWAKKNGYSDKADATRFVYPFKIEMLVHLKRNLMKEGKEHTEYVTWKYDSVYEYATKGKKCDFKIVPSSQITLITKQAFLTGK